MTRQAEETSFRTAEATVIAAALETVPLYRRLNFKFVVMALMLFLAPQVFLYYFSSNQASEMLIESLRDNLKEKSFLVGADIDRFFNQRLHDVLLLSQADVLEADNTNATIQYLTEIIEGTPYLDDIDVINIDGTITASSGEQNEMGKNVLQMFPSLRHIFVDVLAAKQGDGLAQYNLGVIYAKGFGVPQDYKEAVRWYTLAAEHSHQGQAASQFSLGIMYDVGQGVPQDYKEAVRWYNGDDFRTRHRHVLGHLFANTA